MRSAGIITSENSLVENSQSTNITDDDQIEIIVTLSTFETNVVGGATTQEMYRQLFTLHMREQTASRKWSSVDI